MIASGRREIGLARRRVEDPRLVQGAGQYVDDFRLPGTLEAAGARVFLDMSELLGPLSHDEAKRGA